jgi:hypothetical protein
MNVAGIIPRFYHKLIAIFLLLCALLFVYFFQEPTPYYAEMDRLASRRLSDSSSRVGLSIPEEIEIEPFSLKTARVPTVRVTPAEAIQRKMTLLYESSSHVGRSLSNVIPEFYPIETVKSAKTADNVISTLEENVNSIGIISDEAYHQYIAPYKSAKITDELPPIRHIMTLGIETPTILLSPNFQIPGLESSAYQKNASNMFPTYEIDWYDMQFKDRPFRIGTTAPTSTSHRVLSRILDNLLVYKSGPSTPRFMNQRPTIVNVEFNEDAIHKAFEDARIDAYFIMCAHPNTTVYTLVRDKSYQLMGTRGIDVEQYKIIFPRAESVIINTSAYPSYRKQTIRSMQHPVHIVCNANLTSSVIHSFTRSVFENFLRIKTGVGITDPYQQFEYRTQMADFSPSYMYPRYIEFALHPGTDSYFREIGIITTNPAPECGYQVGISKCKGTPYFNPYRIIR